MSKGIVLSNTTLTLLTNPAWDVLLAVDMNIWRTLIFLCLFFVFLSLCLALLWCCGGASLRDRNYWQLGLAFCLSFPPLCCIALSAADWLPTRELREMDEAA